MNSRRPNRITTLYLWASSADPFVPATNIKQLGEIPLYLHVTKFSEVATTLIPGLRKTKSIIHSPRGNYQVLTIDNNNPEYYAIMPITPPASILTSNVAGNKGFFHQPEDLASPHWLSVDEFKRLESEPEDPCSSLKSLLSSPGTLPQRLKRDLSSRSSGTLNPEAAKPAEGGGLRPISTTTTTALDKINPRGQTWDIDPTGHLTIPTITITDPDNNTSGKVKIDDCLENICSDLKTLIKEITLISKSCQSIEHSLNSKPHNGPQPTSTA